MWGKCTCGWQGSLQAGEPCPKCGAVWTCYDCGSSVEGGARMKRITDREGTRVVGFCPDCAEELEALVEPFVPLHGEPPANIALNQASDTGGGDYNLILEGDPEPVGDTVERWLKGLQGEEPKEESGDGGQ